MTTGRRAWRRDLLIAVVFLVLGVLLHLLLPDARFGARPAAPVPGWLALLPLLVAGLGQTLRRSYPVLALLVGVLALIAGPLLVGWVGLAVVIVFTDLLICGVLYSSQRASWAVVAAAAVALVGAVGFALADAGVRAALGTAVEVGFALGVPVAWGLEVRWHRGRAELHRGRAELHRQRAEQAQRLAVLESAAAVAAERARMARDLHDVIAGQLSAIAIQSEAALNLSDADPATLRRVLASVRRDSVASLTEMRAMIGLLRSDGADDEARTAPAGLDRLDTLLVPARATGLHVIVDDQRRDGEPVAAATDLAAFRIVQESLTNAMKHAPGETVRLGLGHENRNLVILVDNDLVGGTRPGGGTGTGLLGLEERARAVGGRFVAGPAGRTWSVRAVLPPAAGRAAVPLVADISPTPGPRLRSRS